MEGKSKHTPVDTCDDRIHSKGCLMVAVLAPNGTAVIYTFMRLLEGIVDACNNCQQPRYSRGDFVRNDGLARVLIVGRERIDYEYISRT